MNIFYLDENPLIAAKMHTKKHVIKMIIESAQMLSCAHHVLDGENAPQNLYKKTHENHPSSVWVRQSIHHYNWLYALFYNLSWEYTKLYNKTHKTFKTLNHILIHPPKNIEDFKFKQPPCAMPDYCILDPNDSIINYQKYYINEKIKNDEDFKRFMKGRK
jgi:hypothetical protein